MHTPRLRILTYNVHRCIGRDGKLMPERIAAAIAELNPDVVALQELDVGCARTGHADQVSLIADALAMSQLFHPICRRGEELYGHALLSRHPLRLIRAAALPTLKRRVALEPRGALWASFDFAGRSVQVLTSHFGLFHRERLAQADALASPEWLSHPHCKSPVIVCGDFNSPPGTRTLRRLKAIVRDPFPWRSWPMGTFPSGLPLLRLDHVLLCPAWKVHNVGVARNRLTRIASDHLPVLAEVSL